MQNLLRTVFICLIVQPFLLGDKFWKEKPLTHWTEKEASQLLRDSPWARTILLPQRISSIDVQRMSMAQRKQNGVTLTVGLFSSVAIRQAYTVTCCIRDREYFEMFEEFHSRPFAGEIVVAVTAERATTRGSSASFYREVIGSLDSGPDSADAAATSLTTDSGRSSALLRYIPPTPDATGAKYIFNRSIDGQPLVGSNDKKLIFRTLVQGIPVEVTFDVRKLFFLGQPDF